ncbi:Protein kinase domain [Trypanosoma vivax]|uniref:Protein kinase domain-containing protein n=1 Tax=Trypanosoma vivax (strain Y486) TaxID=1055687 RepID=G0U1T7_TRYVY|nr:putative protein kinase [Trypanosoma vivax]KAH8618748.1 Protein kinase domain [Trypanosoma vivax]CCC50236.1 putative protein kinase [Trypanosoma vivax Y486]
MMLEALRKLSFVDDVVVDRLRPWRRERASAFVQMESCSLPQYHKIGSEASAVVRTLAKSSVDCLLPEPRNSRMQRSHSSPTLKLLSSSLCTRRTLPCCTVLALRSPQMLVLTLEEPTIDDCESVQRTLSVDDASVQISRLLLTERHHLMTSLCCLGEGSRSSARESLRRTRRRATSTPSLHLFSWDALSRESGASTDTGQHDSSEDGNIKSRHALHCAFNRCSEKRKGGSYTAPQTAPSQAAWRFRCVRSLQDFYVFHPAADSLGRGAFSHVFRAVPIFQSTPRGGNRSTGVPFYAVKVISWGRHKDTKRAQPAKVSQCEQNRGVSECSIKRVVERECAESVTLQQNERTDETSAAFCALESVKREVSILRQLNHSGCSQFVEVLLAPDEFGIVMRMEKDSLNALEYLRLQGRPSETCVALIVYQLVQTVHYIHYECGIIHRDIKLENILLSRVDHSISYLRQVLKSSNGDLRKNRPDRSLKVLRGDKTTSLGVGDKGGVLTDSDKHGQSRWWPKRTCRAASRRVDQLLKVTLIDFGLALSTAQCGNKSIDSEMGASLERGTVRSHCSVHGLSDGRDCTACCKVPSPLLSCVSTRTLVGGEHHTNDVGRSSLEKLAAADEYLKEGRSLSRAQSYNDFINGVPHFDDRDGAAPSVCDVNVAKSCAGSMCDAPRGPALSEATYTDAQADREVPPACVHMDPFHCMHGGTSNSDDAADQRDEDDGEELLHMLPYGTERYMPPEVLQWILHNGWVQKPTSLATARKQDAYAVGVVAYVLLSGCFPFNGATLATTVKQQQRCTPRCDSEHWKSVSAEAISFVQSLLHPDPSTRADMSTVLDHPWLLRAAQVEEKLSLVPHSLRREEKNISESSAGELRAGPSAAVLAKSVKETSCVHSPRCLPNAVRPAEQQWEEDTEGRHYTRLDIPIRKVECNDQSSFVSTESISGQEQCETFQVESVSSAGGRRGVERRSVPAMEGRVRSSLSVSSLSSLTGAVTGMTRAMVVNPHRRSVSFSDASLHSASSLVAARVGNDSVGCREPSGVAKYRDKEGNEDDAFTQLFKKTMSE